jgi:hypothetical protein
MEKTRFATVGLYICTKVHENRLPHMIFSCIYTTGSGDRKLTLNRKISIHDKFCGLKCLIGR